MDIDYLIHKNFRQPPSVPNATRVEHLPTSSPPKEVVSSSRNTEKRPRLRSSRFGKIKLKNPFMRPLYSSIHYFII